MLGKIKEYISNLDNESFEQFYLRYMMNIQDRNLELEVRRTGSINLLSPSRMMQIISLYSDIKDEYR